jgi:hypothetical protein
MIKARPPKARLPHTRAGADRRARRAAARASMGRRSEEADRNDQLRDFMRAMSVELSELAYKNGFDALAVIFDMARQAAESEALASDAHLRRS